MRLFHFFSVLFLSVFLVAGCQKEKVVAKVGTQKVLESDIQLLLKDRHLLSDNPNVSRYVRNLYVDYAQVASGLKLFPNLSAEVEQEMKLAENRLLTSMYQRFYAMEALFIPEKELKEFYKKNTAKFTQNGKNYSFDEVKGKVAEVLYLEKNKNEFDAYFAKRIAELTTPEKADIYYGISEDSVKAKQILNELSLGQKTEGNPEIIHAVVEKNLSNSILGNPTLQSEIFKDSISKRTGLVAVDTAKNKVFVAFRIEKFVPAVEPIASELKASTERLFIEDARKSIMDTTGPYLVKKYELEILPPKPIDTKEYYEKHKEQWKTNPGLLVYHVENKDSSYLKQELSKIVSLDDFKKLAASSKNENLSTRANNGEMGIVLEGHSLPYGVGMLPALFEDFSKDSLGISNLYSVQNTYHAFYVVKHVPATVKPFDRVKNLVESEIASNVLSGDSSLPLVTSKGIPVLYEKDLMHLYNSLDKKEARLHSRTRLAAFLMEWIAFALEAKSLHLDTTSIYKAIQRQHYRYLSRKHIIDSVKNVALLSTKEASPYYEKYKNAFPGKALEDLLKELSYIALSHENDLKMEYFRTYSPDSISFEQALLLIMPKVSKNLPERLILRFNYDAELKNPLVVYDSLYRPEKDFGIDGKKLVAYADSMYSKGELDKALWDYSLARTVEPSNDSVGALATFKLAQLHADRGEYKEALSEYNTFLGIWESHPFAERALFAKGFILDENLNQKMEALKVFRKFLEKYPNTELASSVKWLVQNIESNGALAEELLNKIQNEKE